MTNQAIVDRLAVELQDAISAHRDRELLVSAKVRVPQTLDAEAWRTALLERLAECGIELVELDITFGDGTPEVLSTRFEPGWA